MKIGIDVSQVVYKTGVSNYTAHLFSKIAEIDKKNDYVLFGGSLRQFSTLKSFGANKIYPLPPSLLNILWNKWHVLDIERLIGSVAIFHTSDWSCPPAKTAKKIVPIYDMVVYKYPQTVHPKVLEAVKSCHKWAVKEAAKIVTISQSSKNDIVQILNIDPKKISVVYPAAASQYRPFGFVKNDRPYFLAVGTREPRKNFNRLIEAFEKANLKDVQLWVVGKPGWDDFEIRNPKSEIRNVKFLGFVDQKEMPRLYAGALAFVYPSLYEGFGIPILEAMTMGTPVVTSDISSMPEAGGDAAIYVNPENTDNLVEVLKKVYKMSQAERNSYVDSGFKQAKKFSWEKSAVDMIKIYEELH